MQKINLAQAFAAFSEAWHPYIVGQVNTLQVKVVKLLGEFAWHHHELEDELFLVISGTLRMCFRDREVVVQAGEFIIVPHGVEHKPEAESLCEVLLIEPASTLNTGTEHTVRTIAQPSWLKL